MKETLCIITILLITIILIHSQGEEGFSGTCIDWTLDKVWIPRYFIKGSAELIGSFPSNQNTLYLLCLFYSDNEIITVCCRPEICTLIGWIETSHLCLSFSKVSLVYQRLQVLTLGYIDSSAIEIWLLKQVLRKIRWTLFIV